MMEVNWILKLFVALTAEIVIPVIFAPYYEPISPLALILTLCIPTALVLYLKEGRL